MKVEGVDIRCGRLYTRNPLRSSARRGGIEHLRVGKQRGARLRLDQVFVDDMGRRKRRRLDVEDRGGPVRISAALKARRLQTGEGTAILRRGRLISSGGRPRLLRGRGRRPRRRPNGFGRCRYRLRRWLLFFLFVESAVEQRQIRDGRRRCARLRPWRLTWSASGTSRRRLAEIEENEVARARFRLPGSFSRLRRGVNGLHSLHDRSGVGGASFAVIARPESLQLLDCFVLPIQLRELISEHQPDVVLAGTQIGEFLQRTEGLVQLPYL